MISAILTSLVLAPTLSLPVRVDGEGYMRFVREGRIVYATSATLVVKDGCLISSKGPALSPTMRVPANAIKLEVDLQGNISAVQGGGRAVCGRIVLAMLDRSPADEQGFLVSVGRARLVNPGEGQGGVIRSVNAVHSFAPVSAGATAEIAIQPVSEVSGENVLLKDIAAIKANPQTKQLLESIVICSAPPLGVDFPLTAIRIKAFAKRAGVEAEVTSPVGAVVRRKSQIVKKEDFIAIAIKAAQVQLGVEVAMTSDDNQPDFKAPLGQIELKAEGVKTSGTTMAVTVAVYVDGPKRVNSRTINLKVDSSASIKAGASVKIVMKSAGLSVEVNGKARTGGLVGQSITVVTDTGTVLTGIVLGPDKVEVKI